MLEIINQIFAIQAKAEKAEITLFDRNFARVLHEFENLGYQVVNPLGTVYKNEMTDIEANVTGELTSNSKVTKVLKPVVYKKDEEGTVQLVQKGIVIVA